MSVQLSSRSYKGASLTKKVLPFVYGLEAQPGAAYCITGETIVRDVLGDDSTRTTKSTLIRSVVFRCRGTVLCEKFSKLGENVRAYRIRARARERERERERQLYGFSKAFCLR